MNKQEIKMESLDAADKAELIQWWDALDDICNGMFLPHKLAKGLAHARQCRHPDAQWLSALCPVGDGESREAVVRVMEAQGDDPRALFILSFLGEFSQQRLLRAAELGYAPAQARFATTYYEDMVAWARKAAAQRPVCTR
jgi:hypothetical protein